MTGPRETPEINFQGSGMTLWGLERVLQALNSSGSVLVRNVKIGSVNILSIGATLAAIAEEVKPDKA